MVEDRNKTRQLVCAIIGRMMHNAYSVGELSRLLGKSENNVRVWLAHFYDKGLCYIKEYENVRKAETSRGAVWTAKYAWTDGEPFSRIDAVNPCVPYVRAVVRPSANLRYSEIIKWLAANPTKQKQECAKALGCCNATVSRALAWNKAKARQDAIKKLSPSWRTR